MARQDDWVRVTLRLPREVHAELAGISGAASLNAEIVKRIQAYPRLSEGYEEAEEQLNQKYGEVEGLSKELGRVSKELAAASSLFIKTTSSMEARNDAFADELNARRRIFDRVMTAFKKILKAASDKDWDETGRLASRYQHFIESPPSVRYQATAKDIDFLYPFIVARDADVLAAISEGGIEGALDVAKAKQMGD